MTKRKTPKNAVRDQALKLMAQGLTTEVIAKKLKVRMITVAAWRAHQTMGTYD